MQRNIYCSYKNIQIFIEYIFKFLLFTFINKIIIDAIDTIFYIKL